MFLQEQKQLLPHVEDKRQVSGWEWHPQSLTDKCTTQAIVTVRLLVSVGRR